MKIPSSKHRHRVQWTGSGSLYEANAESLPKDGPLWPDCKIRWKCLPPFKRGEESCEAWAAHAGGQVCFVTKCHLCKDMHVQQGDASLRAVRKPATFVTLALLI